MWLYLPSQFVAESEDSISVSSKPEQVLDCKLFVTLNGKLTARPLSWHGWKSRPWSKRLSGATSQPLMAIHGAGKWVASLGEYHASLTPVLEKDLQKKTKETYGTMHGGSFAKWEQTSCSWRTLEALLTGECPEYSETWPTSGSMQNGVCSVAKGWEPLIGATAYSCWHTPAARDYRGRAAEGPYTNLAKEILFRMQCFALGEHRPNLPRRSELDCVLCGLDCWNYGSASVGALTMVCGRCWAKEVGIQLRFSPLSGGGQYI